MTISYPTVVSVLTEQPPASSAPQRSGPVRPMQTTGRPAIGDSSPDLTSFSLLGAPDRTPPEQHTSSAPGSGEFEVVYEDASGFPILAFADGHWFDVASLTPRPVTVRHALMRDTAWAGAVVQTTCLWMRSNPRDERSFDLATELSLAVGELARQPVPR